MTAKEYLMQAYRLNELIDSDVEELEHLRDLAGRISSPNFDERVQSSKNYDPPFVKYLSDIMEMEQKIHQELCQLVVLKKQISESLEKVEDREERLLLTYRYFNNFSWQEISDRLCVSNRTVHRIHASALLWCKLGDFYYDDTNIHGNESKSHLDVDFCAKLYIIEGRKEGEVAIMLIQFNFKNFKSFREEATLDLSAAKMTEFSDRVVTIGSEKILPVAAIYGANASGKSNIYNAFEYMSDYVADSFKYGDEEEKFEEFRPTPFLFDSTSADAESSFEVYFTLPSDKSERTYNYGFCINKEGVTEEWLNSKAKTARKYSTVFYRGTKDEELDLSGFPKSSRDNIQVALEKQVLIISLGAKLKIGKCKAIRDWFLANEFADFGDPFTNFFMSRRLPKGFVEDKNVQQKVVEYFASFDEHIKDFRIEKVPQEAESKEERYKINALHKKIDSDEMAEIPLGLESAGTLKMFALYPELQEVLEKGSVFFIDELNARLHPLLVRNFLLTFLNPEINTNHAQLVFTTHDTWQLSNQLLRRDEIWFVEKDERGVSTLYSLADFVDEDGSRIRKDESYEKNYLIGKYGAIPTLKSIDIFKEE